jgi:predicted permease
MRILLRRAWYALRQRRFHDELAEEMELHREMKQRELEHAGMAREDAVFASTRALGNATLAREDARAVWMWRWLDDLHRDLDYTLRSVRREPSFTIVAVLTLAIGIGANAALFTLARTALLSTLDVERTEELVEIGCVDPAAPNDPCQTSYPGFLAFASHTDVLSGVTAFRFLLDLNAVSGGRGERVTGLLLSGNAAAVLGLTPQLGRLLDAVDDVPGAPIVAVLSHAYWQRRFGGDPAVIGRTLRLNSQDVTLVGVASASFRGLTLGEVPDLILPLGTADLFYAPRSLANAGSWWLRIIGRRQAGVSMERVQRSLESTFQSNLRQRVALLPPEAAAGFKLLAANGFRLRITSAALGGVSSLRTNLERPIWILWAIVAVVLLMTCANLAGLLLSRTAERRLELGLRVALGASMGRLARQLLTESMVVSLAGGAAAMLLAAWIAPAVLYLAAGEPGLQAVNLRPDIKSLAFTAVLAVTVGALIALASILHAARMRPHQPFRQIRAQGAASRFGRILLSAQVASTFVLVVAAGLFVQTFSNYQRVDSGFAKESIVTAQVAPALSGYAGARSLLYIRQAVSALEHLPGVRAVSYSDLPFATGVVRQTGVGVPEFAPGTLESVLTGHTRVGPRFVNALGLTLIRGRDFTTLDEQRPASVALINETFARHFYGTADPVGKEFIFPTQQLGAGTTIIGIVSDARNRSVKAAPEPWVYSLLGGASPRSAYIFVRADGGIPTLVPAIRRTLETVDAQVPISHLRTLSEQVDETLNRERLLANLSTAFATLALVLVAVGLYGVFNRVVTARTNEIGVRMALGASARAIVRTFAKDTTAIVGPGVVIGLVATLIATPLIRAQLFAVTPTDPLTIATGTAGLLFVVACAVGIPVRRATRVDPMVALRCE